MENTNLMEYYSMSDDAFKWLMTWYRAHCNGDWEHGAGLRIESIDNPGWAITINLEDTELENKKFEEIEVNNSEENWLICFVANSRFEGRCGPCNLLEVLRIFQGWAENYN